ncbi:MAG: hypothetical protein N2166_06055, partial [candidate division WOR-3 bacterium]|nr:hypothetical protein [candidate division WOR-3 bacterium]
IRIFIPEHFTIGSKLLLTNPNNLIKVSISPGNLIVNKDTIILIKYQYERPIKGTVGELYINGKCYRSHTLADSVRIVVNNETEYFVKVKSFVGIPLIKTPTYKINLHQPIQIKELIFTCYYPQYTKLPPKDMTGSELKVLPGSKIKIKGRASQDIVQAKLITPDTLQELKVLKDIFQGEINFKKPDSFKILLTGKDGNTGNTQWHYLLAQNDEPPLIRLFLPGRDINIPVDMQVLIGIYILDDFGLSKLELHYTKSNISETTRLKLKEISNRNEDTIFYRWDLSKINILPGEEIIYYGVVYDNNNVSGAGMAQSETYAIRFPSLSEIFDEATQTSRTTVNQLQPILDNQTRLLKELNQLTEQIQKYRNIDWEQKAKLNELIAKQEELISEINALQKEIERITSDLYSSLMLDKDAIEQLNQISEILNQILPNEIKERLAKLSQDVNKNDPQIAKSLTELKLSSEEVKEGLKRALELLKNIQKEQILINLARKANEIYKQQLQMTERIKSDKNLSQLIEPQNKIGDELYNLQNEIDNTAKEFQEDFVQQELMRISSEFTQKQLTNRSSQIADRLRQNTRMDAYNKSAALTRDLELLKNQLENLANSYRKNQFSIMFDALITIAYNLNRISEMQEELMTSLLTSKTIKVSQQKRLSEVTNVIAETLARYSGQFLIVSPKWIQTLSKAITNMDNAAKLLEEAVHSNTDAAIRQLQTDAIHYLNLVTFQILNQIQFLKNNSPGAKGQLEALLETLSQLTADQMSISQGMGGVPIPIPVPGGLTSEQLAQLQRLMSLQSELRSRLSQLLEEINMGNYGELPGMTGSIEGALEEVRKIEEDFQKLNISRKTIERQEKVIEHLLDAQRSIRQKFSDEKRERVVGKEHFIREIIKLDKNLGENKKQLREEIIRSFRANYPREYEQIIKNYFETLLKD